VNKKTIGLILALTALLAVACGSGKATPTVEMTQAPTAQPTVAATIGIAPTPTAGLPVAAGPELPPGGVEVALAAIEPVEGTLATVNGQEILWADYEPELLQALHSVTDQYAVDWNQADNIALLGTLQDQVLQAVMDRTLLRQVADEEGIEVSEADLQALLDEQKQAIMDSGRFASWDDFKTTAGLSDEYFARLVLDSELVNRLGESLAPDRQTEQVHARHILVADADTGAQVLDRLESGEEWAALAAELSLDTSNKDDAGDLGWFPRGVMVSEFEEAAFSIEPGATSGLVETQFGVHIIQVLEKGMRDMDDASYEAVKQQAFEDWFSGQRTGAEMTAAVQFSTGG